MKMRLKALVLCLLFINATTLKAEWNPFYVMLNQDVTSEDLLKGKSFRNLKQAVFDGTSNSWCSQEKATMLLEIVVLTRPKVCVEIGVFSGSTLLPIAAALKYLNQGVVFGVDAWSSEVTVKYLRKDEPNAQWWSSIDMNAVKQSATSMIQRWELYNYCALIHSPSEKAVTQFDSIDFLHLDGDFSEEGSLKDVQLYLPKVKSGGYILLSNVYFSVDNCLTKIPSFYALSNECEIVCELDNENAILFRKN